MTNALAEFAEKIFEGLQRLTYVAQTISYIDYERLKRHYDETGNPVYAWLAYQKCRKAHDDIPEWILAYFDRVSANLEGMIGTENVTDKLPAALEMKKPGKSGRGTAFSKFRGYQDDGLSLLYACYVQRKINEGHNETDAIYLVAQEEAEKGKKALQLKSGVTIPPTNDHTSVTTVRRHWERAKKLLPEAFRKSPTF